MGADMAGKTDKAMFGFRLAEAVWLMRARIGMCSGRTAPITTFIPVVD